VKRSDSTSRPVTSRCSKQIFGAMLGECCSYFLRGEHAGGAVAQLPNQQLNRALLLEIGHRTAMTALPRPDWFES